MRVEVVETIPEHVIELCETMRARERKAFDALGAEAEHRLTQELAQSLHTWTGLVDGKVVAVVGIKTAGVLNDEGMVWLILSENAAFYPVTFLRRGREHLELMQTLFKKLYGYVQADFGCSVKWLEWLGFTLGEEENGLRRFEWTR
jgi:hypothetical protein